MTVVDGEQADGLVEYDANDRVVYCSMGDQ